MCELLSLKKILLNILLSPSFSSILNKNTDVSTKDFLSHITFYLTATSRLIN